MSENVNENQQKQTIFDQALNYVPFENSDQQQFSNFLDFFQEMIQPKIETPKKPDKPKPVVKLNPINHPPDPQNIQIKNQAENKEQIQKQSPNVQNSNSSIQIATQRNKNVKLNPISSYGLLENQNHSQPTIQQYDEVPIIRENSIKPQLEPLKNSVDKSKNNLKLPNSLAKENNFFQQNNNQFSIKSDTNLNGKSNFFKLNNPYTTAHPNKISKEQKLDDSFDAHIPQIKRDFIDDPSGSNFRKTSYIKDNNSFRPNKQGTPQTTSIQFHQNDDNDFIHNNQRTNKNIQKHQNPINYNKDNPYALSWANNILQNHFHVKLQKDSEQINGMKRWKIRKVKWQKQDDIKNDITLGQNLKSPEVLKLLYPTLQDFKETQLINLQPLFEFFNTHRSQNVQTPSNSSQNYSGSNNNQNQINSQQENQNFIPKTAPSLNRLKIGNQLLKSSTKQFPVAQNQFVDSNRTPPTNNNNNEINNQNTNAITNTNSTIQTIQLNNLMLETPQTIPPPTVKEQDQSINPENLDQLDQLLEFSNFTFMPIYSTNFQQTLDFFVQINRIY